MKKYLVGLLLFAILIPFNVFADDIVMVLQAPMAADYCDALTHDFFIDFDYTGDQDTACIVGQTIDGTLSDATIAAPPVADPDYGGDALSTIGGVEYKIIFNNTNAYFDSKWGEMWILFYFDDVGTSGNSYIFLAQHHIATDYLKVYMTSADRITLIHENNNVLVSITNAGDLTAYVNKWIMYHIKWDSTRCTDGTCDGEDEEELAGRFKVYDGSWGAYGAWVEDTDVDEMAAFATEPGDNDIIIGGAATEEHNIWIAYVEISNAQPSWE